MASRQPSITQNPNWGKAQVALFERLDAALPVVMAYMSDEIPILDNHTDAMIVDEVGDLKKVKKAVENAEKAHVERLKVRMGTKDSLKGDLYEAKFRGGGRRILNQGACKEFITQADNLNIHLGRLLAAIESGQIEVPENVGLKPEKPGTSAEDPFVSGETNEDEFFTSAAGGRALYVEAM